MSWARCSHQGTKSQQYSHWCGLSKFNCDHHNGTSAFYSLSLSFRVLLTQKLFNLQVKRAKLNHRDNNKLKQTEHESDSIDKGTVRCYCHGLVIERTCSYIRQIKCPLIHDGLAWSVSTLIVWVCFFCVVPVSQQTNSRLLWIKRIRPWP